MKFKLPFALNNNTICLCAVALIILLFFLSGAFQIMNYAIVKFLLIGLTSTIAIIVSVILFKDSLKTNRPEDKLQDDSND